MSHGKIKSVAKLLPIIEEEREKGRRVVFTNGCFDLIHVGHTRLLKEAKEKGDILIVGLNTDESIRKLKGSTRPILRQWERLRIIAAFSVVDYVTTFEELDPHRLISQLRPDVLVKGGDYKISEIVGRDVVWANDGEVLSLPLVEGASTSAIITEIVENFAVHSEGAAKIKGREQG